MAAARKRQFSIAGPATAPTAEPAATPDVKTPRRPDVTPQAGPQRERAAFTWRRTPEQALTMDELAIRLKRELGRVKLDHAEILAALTGLAMESPAVFGALTARLQDQRDV